MFSLWIFPISIFPKLSNLHKIWQSVLFSKIIFNKNSVQVLKNERTLVLFRSSGGALEYKLSFLMLGSPNWKLIKSFGEVIKNMQQILLNEMLISSSSQSQGFISN